ncbi:hypothetical protein HaLaN_02787 [Haematococcus lacustris]|uniref:Uncharacterized protein n=1 Tax=Haematococcus lacustris TaxID=44745 RepID=A0A699YCH6_HAELA|nr:hypothetical protein HaLaN_02787 [Haematococcus lacustris]
MRPVHQARQRSLRKTARGSVPAREWRGPGALHEGRQPSWHLIVRAGPSHSLKESRVADVNGDKARSARLRSDCQRLSNWHLRVSAHLLASGALPLASEAMPAQASADTPQLLTIGCSSARSLARLSLVQAASEDRRWARNNATSQRGAIG